MRCRPGQSEAARPHRAGTRLIASLYSLYVSRIMACRVCFPEPGPSTWQNLLTCVVGAPCIWTAFPYSTRIRGRRRAWPPCVPSRRACPAAWLHPGGARSATYGVARGRHRRGHVLGVHVVGRPIGGRPRAHAGPLQDPRRHRQGRKRRSYSGPHGGRGLQDVMPGASLREEWFVSAHAAPKPPRVVRPVRGTGPVRASPVASGFGMVRGTRASAAQLARGAYAPPHRRARPRRMWAGLSKPERARIRSPRTGLLRPAAASAAV